MCDKRFISVCAGRRFGKSYVAGSRILKEATSEYASRRGNFVIYYVAPTASQVKRIMWDGWLLKHVPKEYIAHQDNKELKMTLKNGCDIELFSAEKPDHIVGTGIDLLIIDECALISKDVYEKLRPSLSDRYHDGKALFISTPRGFNWFYEIFKNAETEPDEWASFLFTSLDGGNVEATEIEKAKKTLPQKMFAQEYLASFETMTNLVYESYDKVNNICKKQSYWGMGDIHVGMDFNVNPMTATIAVIEPNENGEDTAYFFDEIVLPNSNTYEMAREIRNKYPLADVYVYPDPTGKKRQTSSVGSTDFTILEEAGFNVLAPYAPYKTKDKINTVNTCFCNANGEHHAYIAQGTCPNLKKCIEGYTYKENGDFDKSQGFDHITDAMAYFLNFKFPIKSAFGVYRPAVVGV